MTIEPKLQLGFKLSLSNCHKLKHTNLKLGSYGTEILLTSSNKIITMITDENKMRKLRTMLVIMMTSTVTKVGQVVK